MVCGAGQEHVQRSSMARSGSTPSSERRGSRSAKWMSRKRGPAKKGASMGKPLRNMAAASPRRIGDAWQTPARSAQKPDAKRSPSRRRRAMGMVWDWQSSGRLRHKRKRDPACAAVHGGGAGQFVLTWRQSLNAVRKPPMPAQDYFTQAMSPSPTASYPFSASKIQKWAK